MKKIIILLFVSFLSFFVFASEVSDLLQEAQTAYGSGDVSAAIQILDSSKAIMEKEQLSSSADDYVEVTNWDIVKLKQSEYKDKKIRFKDTYLGANSNGTVTLLKVTGQCTYDESLIDKLLSLEKFGDYNFYGKVFIKYSTPAIHIEAIE